MFFWLTVTVVLFMTGCSTMDSFAYVPATEVREGPGLFSGDDGVFTITKDSVSFSQSKD